VAGDLPNLNVEVLVQLSNLTAAVQEATAGLNKIGDTAKAQESKFSSLKTTMLGVFAGNVMTEGLNLLTTGLHDAIKAVQDTQVATESLATSMNNAKVNTAANRDIIQSTTEKMSSLGFSVADSENAYNKLITATGSVTESTQLMSMAADLARYKHESLADAAATLEKGTMGSAKAFKEFGITLDANLPKNQAIAKAMDELNAKIGGQAVGYTHTFAGEMEILKAKFDDAAVKVGSVLMPILTKLIGVIMEVGSVIGNVISTFIKPLIGFIEQNKSVFEVFLAVIGGAVAIWGAYEMALKAAEIAQAALNLVMDANPIGLIVIAVAALAAGIVYAWNHFKTFRDIIIDVAVAGVEGFGEIIQILGDVVTAILKIVTGPMKLFLEGLSHLPIVGKGAKEALNDINGATQDVGNFFDSTANKVKGFGQSLEDLKNKKIDLGNMFGGSSTLANAGSAGTGDGSGVTGNLGATGNVSKAATAAQKALDARNAKIKTANDQAVALEDQMNTALTDRQQKMDAATATLEDARAKAQDAFNQTSADVEAKYQDAMQAAQDNYNTTTENLTSAHEQKLVDIRQQYADKATQLQQTAADNQAKIIQSSIDTMTNAFANATKIDLGKLFTDGGSANGLVSQLKDQLAQITQLQQDAGKLAAAGYNQSFIDEVIAQGPAQGDALAESVLTAAPETQDSIKSLYAQVQDASNNGLNDLAKQMNDGTNFATDALAKQYAQVGVTLTAQLADNSAAMQDAITKENDAFNTAMATAQNTLNKATQAANDARDAALIKATGTLNTALNAAQDAFTKSTTSISDAAMKQLDALQNKLDATAAKIQALGGSTASISGYEASVLTPAGVTGAYASSVGSSSPTMTGVTPTYNITNNVTTTDPSLPSLTQGTLNAITLGQTQGILPSPGGGKGMVAV
jgi:hypothetical protein